MLFCVLLRMLLRILEAAEVELCLLEVLEMLEVMRRALRCMLETVAGELCLLSVPEDWR